MTIPSEKLRQKWLKALLPLVSSGGWSDQNAQKAAEAAGISMAEQALAMPNGIRDLIDQFFEEACDQMLVVLATNDLSALRTHERVATGLRAWLNALSPHKEAVRRAAGRGLLPWGAGAATKRVWRIADVVWEAAGDTATDYNRQTKRGLLAFVIPSIVMKWLETDNQDEVDRHIETRLNQAMQLGKMGSKFVAPILDRFAKAKG